MSTVSAHPDFFRVRQRFESRAIADIPAAVKHALDAVSLEVNISAGQSVAIGVGSRGINNLREIVSAVVAHVKAAGGVPKVVTAMGSHGGATAEGQANVLASLGIDESVGCPIQASMATVVVGKTGDGIEAHFDKMASEVDHVFVINRIKPHTRLVGAYESGLIKMLMIGLGNHHGASLYHQIFGVYDYRLDALADEIATMIVERMPITLGVAIVEDSFDQTAHIEAVPANSFLVREPELLKLAKAWMPKLPFDRLGLLIVDAIGKEISGTGMDTNIVGRKWNDNIAGPDEFPKVQEIYVRSLTEKTAGNATGIGIAEYCHQRVVDEMNRDSTRINCLTAGHPTAAAIPVSFRSDREALDAVVAQHGHIPLDELKWLWVSNTLHISEVGCSRGFWDEAEARDDLEILDEPRPLEFDAAGDLS